MKIRKIIHIDMDAYYASVEQRENPGLLGKPVIVGGKPEERGVVSTCSYEARKFGIHSAMSTVKALRLCPTAILVSPHFDLYVKISSDINKIFHEYTDLVEPMSLDEAYLDVTENKKGMPYAVKIAREIKKEIFHKTRLTASAGVSYNKFLAKVASGYKKPDGLTIVLPEDAQEFIDKLPIGNFYGVGKVTEKVMLSLGIRTGLDLRLKSIEELTYHFGKSGIWFYNLSRGIDESPIEAYRERQSIGREITLMQDITDMNMIKEILEEIAFEVETMLKENNEKGKTLTLKIKYSDFKSITRSVTIDNPTDSATKIFIEIEKLLLKTEAGFKKIRLLGISVSNFHPEMKKPRISIQLNLPFQ